MLSRTSSTTSSKPSHVSKRGEKHVPEETEDQPDVVRKFTDTKNRQWVIFFDLAAIQRVRVQCDYDPLSLCDDGCKLMSDVGKDPILLCASVYAAIEPAIKEAGLSPEEFGQAWDGDTWRTAAEVYFSAVADFIRGDGRETILSLLRHGNVMAGRALSIAKTAVNGFDATALSDSEVIELYRSASSSEESAESIHEPSHSTNST